MGLAVSPNGGSARERQRLVDRFGDRLTVNPELTRKAVSYQGNRRVPGLRWLKYKEGFSRTLVEHMLEDFRPTSVLDPFAGIGTTPLIAASRGMRATGVEIMPVGVLAANAIAEAANGVSKRELESAGTSLLDAVTSREDAPSEYAFPHVRITQAAFPPETESAIARVREFLSTVDNDSIQTMLNFACMSVLEAVSYTRKDGQYLRWDYRSGRALRARVNKGPILSFAQALGERLSEMLQDMGPLKQEFGGASPEFLTGSSLELLRGLPDASFDMVMTSPPYANRYDYTRTYALELAWLGYDNDDFATLRQRLLSATVENKSKLEWLRQTYGRDSRVLENAIEMYHRSNSRSRGAGYPQGACPRAGQQTRDPPDRRLLPGDVADRRRTGTNRSPRGHGSDGERQRPVSRRGSAGRPHPVGLCRTVGLQVQEDLDSPAWQGQLQPADE